jgi:tryptophan synthase alpha chain
MAGYPSERAFCRLIESSFDAGADIIEVGIPFSDPVADGPAIQRAGQIALERGMTVGRVFDLLRSLKLRRGQPLVLMSYLNPILQYGLKRFVSEAAQVGVRGLIVPDLVFEEGKKTEIVCRAAKIDLVYLLAPTSSVERQNIILKRSRGFVYAVSALGVTGVRSVLPEQIYERLSALKSTSRIPIAVGFGISSPEMAARAAQSADGIIIGSTLIAQMNPQLSETEQIDRVTAVIRQCYQATFAKSSSEHTKRHTS